MNALIVFALMFALDFVWVGYTRSIVSNHALRAASWAATLVLLNGAVTIAYVADPWLLIPTILGAFAGAYGAIWWRSQ